MNKPTSQYYNQKISIKYKNVNQNQNPKGKQVPTKENISQAQINTPQKQNKQSKYLNQWQQQNIKQNFQNNQIKIPLKQIDINEEEFSNNNEKQESDIKKQKRIEKSVYQSEKQQEHLFFEIGETQPFTYEQKIMQQKHNNFENYEPEIQQNIQNLSISDLQLQQQQSSIKKEQKFQTPKKIPFSENQMVNIQQLLNNEIVFQFTPEQERILDYLQQKQEQEQEQQQKEEKQLPKNQEQNNVQHQQKEQEQLKQEIKNLKIPQRTQQQQPKQQQNQVLKQQNLPQQKNPNLQIKEKAFLNQLEEEFVQDYQQSETEFNVVVNNDEPSSQREEIEQLNAVISDVNKHQNNNSNQFENSQYHETSNYNSNSNSSQQHSYSNSNTTNINCVMQQNFQKQWTMDDFQISRQIGQGKFGKVYLAREKKSKFIVALKVMEKTLMKDKNFEKQLKREIEIQATLNHQNILKMYGFFHDKENIYLILEFAQAGELYKEMLSQKLKRFDEPTAAFYIKQVCEALIYIHQNNIIHRDIKPENLLNSFGTIKLADFGWSVNNQNNSKRQTICGTLDYLSPEIVEGRSHDKQVDIWSIGVLIFEFCTGHPPFETQSYNQTYDKIRRVKLQFPPYLSNEVKDLISKILVYSRNQRLSLENIIMHPWIQKHNNTTHVTNENEQQH